MWAPTRTTCIVTGFATKTKTCFQVNACNVSRGNFPACFQFPVSLTLSYIPSYSLPRVPVNLSNVTRARNRCSLFLLQYSISIIRRALPVCHSSSHLQSTVCQSALQQNAKKKKTLICNRDEHIFI